VAPPALDRRAARDTHKAEQPFAVIGAPPRHYERPCDHAPFVVQNVQARLGEKDRARIRDDGNDGDFPLLAVRLPQPPD